MSGAGTHDRLGSDHPTASNNAHCAAQLAAALCPRPTHVILSPGSRNTALALAFERQPNARLRVVLDERAAGFVALGAGRASHAPAIVLCTSGSAMGHYLPAMMEAAQARVPMIVISADRPAELQHCGAAQTLAQAHAFERWTRLSVALPAADADVDPRWLRNVACRARAAACGSPMGPVHLNAPFRKPLWTAPHRSTELAPATFVKGTVQLDDSAVAALAAELSRKRGVLVLGPTTPAHGPPLELAGATIQLARALGWPCLADPASSARFGGETIGCYDALLRHAAVASALAPQVVLQIGQAPTSKVLVQWLATHAREPTILIDPDGQWHDPASSASTLVVADPAATCEALASRVEACSTAWLKRWRHHDATAQSALDACCLDGEWEGRVARSVVEALPSHSQLHIASSMPIRDVDSFAYRANAVRVYANRGCNGIDGTLSTMLGEALAHPEMTTVSLLGDLAFAHDLGGLTAWANSGARGVAVVVNNAGGGIFEQLPIAQQIDRDSFERLFATPQSLDIGAACAAVGVHHQCVAASQLSAAIAATTANPGLAVLEVKLDRADSVARRAQAFARVAGALQPGDSG